MKHSLLLKHHIPYAAMICKALDLCEIMLARCDTIYPFAALTMENDTQCVFTPSVSQDATSGLIEELEMRIAERQMYAESSVSLLVYCATISTGKGSKASAYGADIMSRKPSMTQSFSPETDALVFNITDSAGKNNVTIYPYSFINGKVCIHKPYTCDFSD
jgi:hypothetical protein